MLAIFNYFLEWFFIFAIYVDPLRILRLETLYKYLQCIVLLAYRIVVTLLEIQVSCCFCKQWFKSYYYMEISCIMT